MYQPVKSVNAGYFLAAKVKISSLFRLAGFGRLQSKFTSIDRSQFQTLRMLASSLIYRSMFFGAMVGAMFID